MDRDREDSMDDMMAPPALTQPAAINSRPNLRPHHQRAPNNYTALLDSDETFFERLLTTEDGLLNNPTTQLAGASRPRMDLSTIPNNNSTRPPRRSLTSPCWSDAGMATPPPPKRLQVCNDNGSSPSKCTTTTTTNNNNNNKNASSGSNSSAANNSSGSNSNSNHGGSTIAALLDQFPQGAAYQHQTILGSLGEGGAIFQQPYQLSGANWSSL